MDFDRVPLAVLAEKTDPGNKTGKKQKTDDNGNIFIQLISPI